MANAERCICCGEIIPEGMMVCPTCQLTVRESGLTVKFSSEVSGADNCMCHACHHIGRVVKLKLPLTMYHDGKRLSTTYSNYWLCFNCREKLIDALMWGDGDGK